MLVMEKPERLRQLSSWVGIFIVRNCTRQISTFLQIFYPSIPTFSCGPKGKKANGCDLSELQCF